MHIISKENFQVSPAISQGNKKPPQEIFINPTFNYQVGVI